MTETELFALNQHLIGTCTQMGLSVSAAESLTGGRFVAALVDVPGASAVVRGGLVTYATDLKASLAGVDPEHLEESGPVDPLVAAQMAAGAARSCVADIGVSCTGVAGPDPQDGKDVGLVYTAIAFEGRATVCEHQFSGDRDTIRNLTVAAMAKNLDEFVTTLAFGPVDDSQSSDEAASSEAGAEKSD